MKFLIGLLFLASWLFGAVNLNTASKEELMSVKGIGETKAQAILDYRSKSLLSLWMNWAMSRDLEIRL